jgi:hypothetical protein
MRSCDACGERATSSCPYCNADACPDCIGICEHDARKPKQPAKETGPARMQELNAKYAGRERGDDGGELTPNLSEQP